jgi:putative tricarboxylic transport membrane protein
VRSYSPAPIVMGLILGSLVEDTLKQSLIIFDHSWLAFAGRPIALIFFALTALSIAAPIIASWRRLRTP